MLDKALYTKTRKAVKNITINQKLRKLVIEAVNDNRAKSLFQPIKRMQPELIDLVAKLFPEMRSQSRISNVAILYGLFDITHTCESCGGDCTLTRNVYCSLACQREGMSSKMREQRANEDEATKRRRTKRIQEALAPQREEITRKVRESLLSRSAEEVADATAKLKATMRERYGVENSMHIAGMAAAVTTKKLKNDPGLKKAMRKKEETMLDRYGVRHQAHMEGKAHSFKTYHVTIKGVEYACQGYEEGVLRYLISEGYKVTTQVSSIPYTKKRKEHRYYPDMEASRRKQHLIVEVKSVYTFKWTKQNCPEKFFAGTRQALDSGSTYLVFVTNNKSKALVFTNPKALDDLHPSKAEKQTIRGRRLP